MSSTTSPIPSGPTNAETHNSSTAQKSWRHPLYFSRIQAWRVCKIEFQCCLARFVLSKRFELRGNLAVNHNRVWEAIWWIHREKRCATRNGWVPDVECRVGKGSDDSDGRVRNEIGGRNSRPRSAYPAEQPIQQSSPSIWASPKGR
jgi:hypothetical protein